MERGIQSIIIKCSSYFKISSAYNEKNGGTIVNISSYSAKDPNLSFPTSSTIRAGLSAFV